MYVLSETLQAAISAENPQRVLIEFLHYEDDNGTHDYVPHVEFSNEDILITNGLTLTTEFNSETDLTIGLCPSAEIRFSMLNDAEQLAGFQFGTFKAYLGAKITSGTPAQDAVTRTFPDGLYEFAPLGVFIATRPDIVRKKVIDVDANDQMTLFDEELPEGLISFVVPRRLDNIAQALCSHVGVQLQEGTWLNSEILVSKAPERFEGATMREVIGWIAEAGCSIARFNREGKLEFVWFRDTERTFNESDYSEFTPTWYETQAIDSLHIRNADETAERTVGTGSNAYMIQDNPFLKSP